MLTQQTDRHDWHRRTTPAETFCMRIRWLNGYTVHGYLALKIGMFFVVYRNIDIVSTNEQRDEIHQTHLKIYVCGCGGNP